MKTTDFIAVRRALHQIPELGFQEVKTQAYVTGVIQDLLQTSGRKDVEVVTWKTGILVFVPGKTPKKTIAYRSDMDGLPMTEQTGLPFASLHEGSMHACGHDVHMAIALGVLSHFLTRPMRDNLLVIFQPAEEGPGGARPMVHSSEYQRYLPDEIYALHVAPELPVGCVSSKPGILFSACSEFDIEIRGVSSHAATPQNGRDVIVASSHLVSQLQTVISRYTDPTSPTVLTIGELQAGSARNIIPEKAILKGTLRSTTQQGLEKVYQDMERVMSGCEQSFDCCIRLSIAHEYMEVQNDAEKTTEFLSFATSHPKAHVVPATTSMASEDFGYFLHRTPGVMFWLGVNAEHGLHTPYLQPDEEAIPFAISFVCDYFQHLSENP